MMAGRNLKTLADVLRDIEATDWENDEEYSSDMRI